jgi:hypothetical protein
MERDSTRLTFHDVHELHITNLRTAWNGIQSSPLQHEHHVLASLALLAEADPALASMINKCAERQTRDAQVGPDVWSWYVDVKLHQKRVVLRRGDKRIKHNYGEGRRGRRK